MSTRYAMILSCEEYENSTYYPTTPYCHNDSWIIANTLKEYCDYKDENMQHNFLYKGIDENPSTILGKLQEILNTSSDNDTILFYYAGHGVVDNDEAYLVLPDTNPNDLKNTSLSLKKINELLSHNNRYNIRIFDACHSGYKIREEDTKFNTVAMRDIWATFSACDGTGYSYPDITLEQGIFTYSICEIIKEWEKGKEILIEELKIRVCYKMKQWCTENSKVQVPTLNAYMQGNINIAVRNNKITEKEVIVPENDSNKNKGEYMMNNLQDISNSQSISVWDTSCGLSLPKTGSGDSLLTLAMQLREKEVIDYIQVYQLQKYEMVAESIWERAISILREKVLGFGEKFVSEMVGVSDLRYIVELPPFEVINIASELGFIDKTGRMRLNHANEIVKHYLSRDIKDEMPQNEVDSVIRASIQYILGLDNENLNFEYSDFRESLKVNPIENTPDVLEMLKNSPYFYRKTTVRTLINLMKETQAGEFDIVIANLTTILVALWDKLSSEEKYFIGATYAQYANTGEKKYIKPIKSVLVNVHGFDYVPENLRSFTFIETAKRIIEAHNGFDNFYNEPPAVRKLERLGAVIPKPALKTCISAVLMVKLGNAYNVSFEAQNDANKILQKLSLNDWKYYLEQCLPYDEDILWKISSGDRRTSNWIDIVNQYNLKDIDIVNSNIIKIVSVENIKALTAAAKQLYNNI